MQVYVKLQESMTAPSPRSTPQIATHRGSHSGRLKCSSVCAWVTSSSTTASEQERGQGENLGGGRGLASEMSISAIASVRVRAKKGSWQALGSGVGLGGEIPVGPYH